MAARSDISFPSGDGTCTGWLYRPDTAGGSGPCVVLAHGFGACKEGRLDAFAERFAAAGMAALVFDYRHFGQSTGEPRQLVHVGRQHEDWRSAIAYARSLGGIDPERIALWGSSFSGGHVVATAARDDRVAAVVSQVPHASGTATLLNTGPRRNAWMTYEGIRDRAGAVFGRTRTVPLVGPPGSLALMTGDDAEHAYPGMYPDGFPFHNAVPARFALTLASYSPVRDAAKVRCPLLVIVSDEDTITPPKPAKQMAERAPQGRLLTCDGGHFEIYRGELFEWAVSEEARFLGEAA